MGVSSSCSYCLLFLAAWIFSGDITDSFFIDSRPWFGLPPVPPPWSPEATLLPSKLRRCRLGRDKFTCIYDCSVMGIVTFFFKMRDVLDPNIPSLSKFLGVIFVLLPDMLTLFLY